MTAHPHPRESDAPATPEPAVVYTLAERGPPVFATPPPCRWCNEPAHPPLWRACPLVVVPLAALTPARRRLRHLLS